MNKSRAFLIFSAPIVGLSAFFYFSIVSPMLTRIDELHREQRRVEKDLSALLEKIFVLKQESRTIDMDPNDVWVGAQKNLLRRTIQAEIIKMTEESGFQINRFSETVPHGVDPNLISGLEIEVNGSLRNLLYLLSTLEQKRPRLSVHSMMIRPDGVRPGVAGETAINVSLVVLGITGVDA